MAFLYSKLEKEAGDETDRSRNEDGVSVNGRIRAP